MKTSEEPKSCTFLFYPASLLAALTGFSISYITLSFHEYLVT